MFVINIIINFNCNIIFSQTWNCSKKWKWKPGIFWNVQQKKYLFYYTLLQKTKNESKHLKAC